MEQAQRNLYKGKVLQQRLARDSENANLPYWINQKASDQMLGEEYLCHNFILKNQKPSRETGEMIIQPSLN